jgi:succinylglutamic semialdehyde dehydrogenase
VAGNTVVLKPSERTPATALLLGQIASKSGVPAGVFQVAIGDGSVGLALAVHEGVQGVLFCGSSQTGQTLAKRLAGRPDRLLSLRLGGNNPLVVWDTPSLDDAAVLVVQSAFGCAGQRSTAARRLIVRDTLADDLLARVKTLADRIICGAPFDEPAPFMGPVIAPEMADGLTQSFIWLMSNGGHPIKHMQRLKDGLPFISPAIIDVTSMATRPDVELYGPLLQVVRVPDFDAAIAEANATRYGLAAGLIGGTQQDYGQFWARVRAGQIHWNRTTTASLPAAPLGTVGVSGNFRAGGVYMTDACAYPVASAEAESPRAAIGAGFASV